MKAYKTPLARRQRVKARADLLKSRGLCVWCKAPSGTRYCPSCQRAINYACKKHRNRRIRVGLCFNCDLPARPGKTRCSACALRESQRRKSRVLQASFRQRAEQPSSAAS